MWAELGFGKINLMTSRQSTAIVPHPIFSDSLHDPTTLSHTLWNRIWSDCASSSSQTHCSHMVGPDTSILTQWSHAWRHMPEHCSQPYVLTRSPHCYDLIHISLFLGHCPNADLCHTLLRRELVHSGWKVGSSLFWSPLLLSSHHPLSKKHLHRSFYHQDGPHPSLSLSSIDVLVLLLYSLETLAPGHSLCLCFR